MYLSDIFVFLDNAQFKRPSWQNRTEIWFKGEKHRITVPIKHTGKKRGINETELADSPSWSVAMLETLRHEYGLKSYFETWERKLSKIISNSSFLAELNMSLIWEIIPELDLFVNREFILASDLPPEINKLKGDAWMRAICWHCGADKYIAGEIAIKEYLRLPEWKKKGIEVVQQDYPCDYDRGNISIIDPLIRFGQKTTEWVAID